MSHQLERDHSLSDKFPDVDITIPQTFVIATDAFKIFIEENNLSGLLEQDPELEDDQVVSHFLAAELP